MARRNYELGLYKEFELLNEKIDKLLSTNQKQTLTIQNLNLEIEKLNKIIEEKDKKIELLLEKIDKLENKNNKNSSNSSKPSSTDMVRPKKSGANLYNSRIKTNNKVGGQKGHDGHNLNKEKIEKMISEGKIIVNEIIHKINGNSKRIPTIKYRLCMKINTYVEKHIFIYDEKSNNKLPKEFYSDVTYDNYIKALAIELGTYNIISYNRLSDFFNVLTNGIINISQGTLVNFSEEFSNKSIPTLLNIKNNLLNGKNMGTDETSAKYNKKNIYVRNYSNSANVLYKAHERKGHDPIKEDNILPIYTGGIIGDHDTVLYSYGVMNYECNIHMGRYLEELIQNIPNIVWPRKMKKLLFSMNEDRKQKILENESKFTDIEINNYYKEYDDILEIAKKENLLINSVFYRDKADKLYRRLRKYKENHLYFIKDFKVLFDNNISERDLRIFKIKTKVSGGFRSHLGIERYVNALSIIKTSKKRNINPFNTIKNIFNNKVLFA